MVHQVKTDLIKAPNIFSFKTLITGQYLQGRSNQKSKSPKMENLRLIDGARGAFT